MAYLSGNIYKYADINKLPPKAIKRYGRVLVYTKPEELKQTIVVRGSMLLKYPRDLLMNINISHTTYNDYRIHSGFFHEAVKVLKELKGKGAINKSYSIDLTGHSSGGCIACILGLLMHEEYDGIEDIITFGQPKFIKDAYGCPINLTRIVNIADPVPLVPIRDFRHMGNPYILDPHNHGDLIQLRAHEMRNYINNAMINMNKT
jgi:hypothetical protein